MLEYQKSTPRPRASAVVPGCFEFCWDAGSGSGARVELALPLAWALPLALVMTLVMTWFTNVMRGVGPAVDFWYPSMRPPAPPPSSLPPDPHGQSSPITHKKTRRERAGSSRGKAELLQLDLFVFHVLTCLRIKFHDQHFVGRGFLVFGGRVKVTSAGS